MTRPAGYIRDQTCPTNPDHGHVWIMEDGLFCSHADHSSATPPTPAFWSWDAWETAKANESPTNQDQPKRTPDPHPPKRKYTKRPGVRYGRPPKG